MRRAGLILLCLGLGGFLLGTLQRERFDSPAGGAEMSDGDRKARDAWETARWLFVGTAVIGLVFTALPGKK